MAPAIGTKLCWRILREQRGVLGVTRMSVGRYCCASSHAGGDVDEEKLNALRKIYPLQPPGNSTNIPWLSNST